MADPSLITTLQEEDEELVVAAEDGYGLPEDEEEGLAEGDVYQDFVPETEEVEVLNDDDEEVEGGAEEEADAGDDESFLAEVDRGLDDRAKLMAALKVSLGKPDDGSGGGGSSSAAAATAAAKPKRELLEEEPGEPPAKRARTLAEMPTYGGAPPSTVGEAQALAAKKEAMLQALSSSASGPSGEPDPKTAATMARAPGDEDDEKEEGEVGLEEEGEERDDELLAEDPDETWFFQVENVTEEDMDNMSDGELEDFRRYSWGEFHEQCDAWAFCYDQHWRVKAGGPSLYKGLSDVPGPLEAPPMAAPAPALAASQLLAASLEEDEEMEEEEEEEAAEGATLSMQRPPPFDQGITDAELLHRQMMGL